MEVAERSKALLVPHLYPSVLESLLLARQSITCSSAIITFSGQFYRLSFIAVQHLQTILRITEGNPTRYGLDGWWFLSRVNLVTARVRGYFLCSPNEFLDCVLEFARRPNGRRYTTKMQWSCIICK